MDDFVKEESKPFDHELIKDTEDAHPDPNEELETTQGVGRAWSVKIPKHLMERWSAINQDDIHLATIRVYDKDPRTGRARIVMLIPPEGTMDSCKEPPDEYELDMLNDAVNNQYVIAERPAAPEQTTNPRARKTILTGVVKHDCNLRPGFTENYRMRMRERNRAANTPKRQIRMMDEVEPGRGRINMLTSGVAHPSGFSTLVKPKPKPAKGQFERFARIPRNQLLDLIFALYREKPRWSARELRTRTEQPEAYLKEVLAEITDLHRSGEYNGLYELKPNFRESAKTEEGASAVVKTLQEAEGAGGSRVIDMDDYDEDEDDEDDEDDMEEVS